MSDPVKNLRIHFYGVQGSGSIFPSKQERADIRQMWDYQLLDSVFEDLAQRCDENGRLTASIEEILGGPPTKKNLLAYRSRFDAPEGRIYGGWTTCVRVETGDGYDVVFDCGSGFRNCARDLQLKWGDRPERHLHLFGSHSHLDHTEGFDQAAVCFDPRNSIHIYSNRTFLRALDQNLGIFTREVSDELMGVQTPLSYVKMPTTFSSCEIRDLEAEPASAEDTLADHHHHIDSVLELGQTTVRMIKVCHPAPCLAYRLDHGGKSFVFCTDHELYHGEEENPLYAESREAEARLEILAKGADLMYRDGQYFRAEYDGYQGIGSGGPVPRIGWGHSCMEDVMDMAVNCNVKMTHIGHHDPNRAWSERNWIDEALARRSEQTGLGFALAQAEVVIDL